MTNPVAVLTNTLQNNASSPPSAAPNQSQQQYAQDGQEHGVMPSNVSTQSFTSGHRDDSNVVGLHYKIGKKIGEGSFGVLFEGVNLINGVQVAIKFEPRKSEAPQLRDEYKTYKILTDTPGIPHAYYLGQQGLHNILVIDLLGPSLEDLFEWCSRRFSVKTVVQVAVQMISLLEHVHNHDLIYRDIKPDNFLIGRPGSSTENMVHLIDFGMAKQYRDPKTKKHIPYREKKSLSGTARYMSINTHLGREQSRRDDMESLGHVFFYFLRGQLPWQGLKAANNKQKYERIGEKKRLTNVYDLAQGVPVQFGRYLDIVRNLDFEEVPDYEGYRQLLISSLTEQNLSMDGEYDWMQLNGGNGWDLSINKKPNLHGYGRPNPPMDKNKRKNNNTNTNTNTNTPVPTNNNNNTNVNVAVGQSIQQQQQVAQQQQAQQQALQQQQAQQAQQQAQQAHQQQQQLNQQLSRSQSNQVIPPEQLDPNSYEAYQKQTEAKYQKSQQQQQQQQSGQRYGAQGGAAGVSQGQPRFASGNYAQQQNGSSYRPTNTPNYLSQQSPSNSQNVANGQNRPYSAPQAAYGGYQNGAPGSGLNSSPNNQQLQQNQQYRRQGENESEQESKGFFSKLGCC